MRSEDYLSFHLKPLNADADSEEDAEGKTDVTDTLGYGVDDGEDMVSPAKSNGGDKEVTEKEDEISDAEAGQEMIENVVHLSENADNCKYSKTCSRTHLLLRTKRLTMLTKVPAPPVSRVATPPIQNFQY